MNIYDPYPETVEHNGKTIRLNLSYDRVLRAIDAQGDALLLPADRIRLQCEMLLRRPKDAPKSTKEQAELLSAIFDLFPKDENPVKKTERYIDLHQDAGMIRSAFFRIGIDLQRDHIHFFRFRELLKDLPADTALMRTIEIRMKPVPKPDGHNQEQIAALMKAKAAVAIKMSEEELRERFAQSLKNSSLLTGR